MPPQKEDPKPIDPDTTDPVLRAFLDAPKGPPRPETDERRRRRQDFDERRASGMWTIKHEAVVRRHRAEVVRYFEVARLTLSVHWPGEAIAMYEALTAYSLRHERKMSKEDAQELLALVDRIGASVPPRASEIVRLAKLAYVGDPKYREELLEACRRMNDDTRIIGP